MDINYVDQCTEYYSANRASYLQASMAATSILKSLRRGFPPGFGYTKDILSA